MSPIRKPFQQSSTGASTRDEQIELRTQELFEQDKHEVYVRTDRHFAYLMGAQWVLGVLLAIFVTPQTWIGATPYVHIHVWVAAVFGGLVSAGAIYLAIRHPGAEWTRHSIAIAQSTWTALLIHLTGGRIETHFYAFGSMAFLAFYRDWRVIVTATCVIITDYVARGTLWPMSVYGVPSDTTTRLIEHTAWLTWIDIFLVASCVSHRRQAIDGCRRQATLEWTNADVEHQVQQRAYELKKVNSDLEHEYEAREELYTELMAASKKAGRAEVATGVLHNVGNVLNSLNVSVQTLSEYVRKSPADKLVQASNIISQQSDVGRFINEDSRGKHFPQMLEQLSERLSKDRENELHEIQSLVSSLEHAREVISTQQIVARDGKDVLETIRIEQLVADARRITGVDTKTHLEVVQENKPITPLLTDKHKVLQILINLLNNAEQAIRNYRGNGVLAITIHQDPDDVRVLIQDDGMGISKENLTKIFGHGFTTKKEGHGFGLHSCALAAQTLGGSLSVASEGEGFGATFSLTLPIEHKANETTMEALLK